ncbi:MAG: hypothetical protein GX879_01050, partial [Bacteroidales bacterium]|nr:hypothetical protein [Bacteroidales bacterium]
KVREKRIEVFEKLIPKIEAYKSLNKEDAQTFGFVLLGELMQFSEDADEETEKLGALLDDFEHEDDDYRKDVLALNLLVMFFIDDDADEMEEEIAELSEHVGI